MVKYKSCLKKAIEDCITTKANAMEGSLGTYLKTVDISDANTPKDIGSINGILKKLYDEHQVRDLFDLVGNKPELLDRAIIIAADPLGAVDEETALHYEEAHIALKNIRENLREYKKLDTYTETKFPANNRIMDDKDGQGQYVILGKEITESVSNRDGFKNYVEQVKRISEFKGEYSTLFDIIDTQYIEDIDRDIAMRKLECFRTPLILRLKHNKSDYDGKIFRKDDPSDSIYKEYDISQKNCNSHFPAFDFDEIITSSLKQVETLIVTKENGVRVIDDTPSIKSVIDYAKVVYDIGEKEKVSKILEDLVLEVKNAGYDITTLEDSIRSFSHQPEGETAGDMDNKSLHNYNNEMHQEEL